MPTTADLGRLVKQKYPGKYDDLSDAEVGRRIKAKYPGSYEDYLDTAIEPKRLPHEVMNYFEPHRGRFGLWMSWKRAEGRARLLDALSREQKSVLEQGARLEKAALDSKKNEVAFRTFVAQHAEALVEIRAKAELIEQALERGYTLENDQQIKVSTELLNLKLVEAEQLSQLKVKEHRELKTVDLDHRLTEMREQVRLALIAKHLSEVQKVAIVQENIDGIIKQIDQIEADNALSDKAKQRMIEDREEIISTLKENRRGIQRLLEAHNRGDVSADDEDTDI